MRRSAPHCAICCARWRPPARSPRRPFRSGARQRADRARSGQARRPELNYSSDIDLILLYDGEPGAPPPTDHAQPLFTRVARDLVRILDERTGDGYVFRTDLRLRPDRARRRWRCRSRGAGLLRKRRPELGARSADQGASRGRRPPRRRVPRELRPLSGARTSISRRSRTFIRSSARSMPIEAAARSRSRGTTSRSAAAASARSSFSRRRSS